MVRHANILGESVLHIRAFMSLVRLKIVMVAEVSFN